MISVWARFKVRSKKEMKRQKQKPKCSTQPAYQIFNLYSHLTIKSFRHVFVAHCALQTNRFLIRFDFNQTLLLQFYIGMSKKKQIYFMYYYRLTRCYQLIVYIDSFMKPGSVCGANTHMQFQKGYFLSSHMSK